MQENAHELLHHTTNKYELVLSVARRAKDIKDDPNSLSVPEAHKPIRLALRELADSQRKERESAI